jgi:GTP-binding protein
MKITSAEFVMSNTNVAKCPNEPLPEYAFIGRSNVGKSSLINMLVERKALAKTSGRPGKTQLINHFKINNNWFLVDLPGYGYARVSKKDKKTFQKYITEYFQKRKQIPFAIIFTKADKLKPAAIERQANAYLQKLLEGAWEEAPPHFTTSSTNRMGRDELLGFIDSINQDFFKTQ